MSVVVPDGIGQRREVLAPIRMVPVLPRPVAVVLAMDTIPFADLM
jgi:hypothetical protein